MYITYVRSGLVVFMVYKIKVGIKKKNLINMLARKIGISPNWQEE